MLSNSAPSPSPKSHSILSLPTELLLLISDNLLPTPWHKKDLDSTSLKGSFTSGRSIDVLNFAATCKSIYLLVNPVAYRNLSFSKLSSLKLIKLVRRLIQSRENPNEPDLCLEVRNLEILEWGDVVDSIILEVKNHEFLHEVILMGPAEQDDDENLDSSFKLNQVLFSKKVDNSISDGLLLSPDMKYARWLAPRGRGPKFEPTATTDEEERLIYQDLELFLRTASQLPSLSLPDYESSYSTYVRQFFECLRQGSETAIVDLLFHLCLNLESLSFAMTTKFCSLSRYFFFLTNSPHHLSPILRNLEYLRIHSLSKIPFYKANLDSVWEARVISDWLLLPRLKTARFEDTLWDITELTLHEFPTSLYGHGPRLEELYFDCSFPPKVFEHFLKIPKSFKKLEYLETGAMVKRRNPLWRLDSLHGHDLRNILIDFPWTGETLTSLSLSWDKLFERRFPFASNDLMGSLKFLKHLKTLKIDIQHLLGRDRNGELAMRGLRDLLPLGIEDLKIGRIEKVGNWDDESLKFVLEVFENEQKARKAAQ